MEFPSGYIENNETIIDAAKRELEEETGYSSNNIIVKDATFSSPGIDNSIVYIAIANYCYKTNGKIDNGNELISYDLFSEYELINLIKENMISGAINKLAFYELFYDQKITCENDKILIKKLNI